MADPRLDNPRPRGSDTHLRGTRGRSPDSLPWFMLASPWSWGTRPGRLGVFTITLGTALGAILTLLAGSDPGVLLCVFMVGATVIAAFAVRPGAGYLIIPVPALAYVGAALVTGLIHDRAGDTSRALLAVNAVQWIASGFIAMVAATVVAIVVAAGRSLAARRARPVAGARRSRQPGGSGVPRRPGGPG